MILTFARSTIQRWNSFIPMLMLTTESQAEKKDAGRKASATGWIVNPFDSDQLVAVVQKLVN